MRLFRLPLTVTALLVTLLTSAHLRAEEVADTDFDRSIFGFAGAMTDHDMLNSAALIPIDYERNALIGGGYQIFPYELGKFRFGAEAGLAARIGDNATGEVWGGVVGRYDQIRLTNRLYLSPAFTFGISHVTGAQPGRERRQERDANGNARTLFYLGPEINLSFNEDSDTEMFWRLHHRSGAWHTLGNMKGGSNANVIGIRRKF